MIGEKRKNQVGLLLFLGKLPKRNKKPASLSLWYKTFFVHFFSLLPFPFLRLNEINSFMNQNFFIKIETIDKIPIYTNLYFFFVEKLGKLKFLFTFYQK